MSSFFSPSTRGFYSAAVHGDNMPADVVQISQARHRQLVEAQAAGATIAIGHAGRPVIHRAPDTLAGRRRAAVQAVKREARRRILVVAPAWRQTNDNSLLALAAFQLSATMTSNVDTTGPLARRRAIDALRAASDRLEERLETMGGPELLAFDPSADTHWSSPE